MHHWCGRSRSRWYTLLLLLHWGGRSTSGMGDALVHRSGRPRSWRRNTLLHGGRRSTPWYVAWMHNSHTTSRSSIITPVVISRLSTHWSRRSTPRYSSAWSSIQNLLYLARILSSGPFHLSSRMSWWRCSQSIPSGVIYRGLW